ncbi:uncharacterized protein LOC130996762 [Salvia miltiorrhiza]|uniref:uncharacterized protein LOC130996762 n=1 Tax=Salvia miltiorrhiza TaxID=226208 RepID=UPI0025AC9067|nr:uncharacterized protein LOC130996762 [Salvia miltiorrhiza]
MDQDDMSIEDYVGWLENHFSKANICDLYEEYGIDRPESSGVKDDDEHEIVPNKDNLPIECKLCGEETYKSEDHAISVLPCGDVFGFSCIFLAVEKEKKCPKCNAHFDTEDIITLQFGDD